MRAGSLTSRGTDTTGACNRGRFLVYWLLNPPLPAENDKKETHDMTYTYYPTGVCSSQIDLELEDGVIQSVAFTGGCNGNLKGISTLVQGMPAREAIEKLQGTTCGWKPTSCPDQLSKALAAALAQEQH